MKRILVSDPLAKAGIDILKTNTKFTVDVKTGMPADELIKIIPTYDGLLVRSETKVTKEVLAAAKKLKIIGRAGSGVDNIDVKEASKKGIVVMNVPGGNTISAAEHTVSMLLSLSRNIPQANASLKRCEWKKKDFIGVEIFGKTVGVIGFGKIGAEVAKRLLGFGVKILVCDPFISLERAAQIGVEPVPLKELFKRSDYITVHTPKTDATKNLINADTICEMKDGVMIVNCARGGIIDEKALAAALKSGKIKGAALDVFEKEPLCESPFFEMNNVIMTPHLGASTIEAQTNVSVEIVKQMIQYFSTGVIINALNFPFISGDMREMIQPFMDLAERIGLFAVQIADEGIKSVDIEYSGDFTKYDTAPITISALRGILSKIADNETVNYINAAIIAGEHGIKVSETKGALAYDFANLVSIIIKTNSGDVSVSGTVFGKNELRIVKINDYYLDVEPDGNIIVFSNTDEPGVVGKVGTILGENCINIASMEVGRKVAGTDAITVINVDGVVGEDVLKKLEKQKEIKNIRTVTI
ncbi:MAG: D-3-phosphoglycerate dehydrogenase [Elusimicrobia bacterium ADurb.Bin231]|nr:MAG: D-3-phosphoglycerate dehydrogenase [Elusimicrobia bacterium ADurb.Bin231]